MYQVVAFFFAFRPRNWLARLVERSAGVKLESELVHAARVASGRGSCGGGTGLAIRGQRATARARQPSAQGCASRRGRFSLDGDRLLVGRSHRGPRPVVAHPLRLRVRQKKPTARGAHGGRVWSTGGVARVRARSRDLRFLGSAAPMHGSRRPRVGERARARARASGATVATPIHPVHPIHHPTPYILPLGHSISAARIRARDVTGDATQTSGRVPSRVGFPTP